MISLVRLKQVDVGRFACGKFEDVRGQTGRKFCKILNNFLILALDERVVQPEKKTNILA